MELLAAGRPTVTDMMLCPPRCRHPKGLGVVFDAVGAMEKEVYKSQRGANILIGGRVGSVQCVGLVLA